ncbi:MAG: hypothetical protein ACLVB5_06530 [Christensenellales bacterium]
MKALVQAQISAASMGHEKMGSGHLLCGLCRVGDELTRCILGDLTAGEIEEEVLRRCGRGEVGFSRVTGLTPHAQRALLRAVTYANPEKKILAGIAHISAGASVRGRLHGADRAGFARADGGRHAHGASQHRR